MGRIEKTVFISYRRTSFSWALAIFQDLTQHGFDVFFDYTGINSGDFESVIIENIKARAHFVVLLTPYALERCGQPGDWLRREIETALQEKRNIIPLMLENFDFGAPGIGSQLTGDLEALKSYNGLRVPPEYFREAMGRLRDKYLGVPLDAVVHPLSVSAQQAAQKEQAAAATAPAVAKTELGVTESTLKLSLWKRFRTLHLGWRALVVLVVGTILALAATLIVRGGQSEKAKREAAEDAQWADTVKKISQNSALNPFLKSPRYGDAARSYAVQILANSSDEVLFGDLFGAAFVPTSWTTLDQILKLDRALRTRQQPLDAKSYDAQSDLNDLGRLSQEEMKINAYYLDALAKICSQIGSVLQSTRPSVVVIDLSGTYLYNCNWGSADLSDANLDEAQIVSVDLKGARLAGVIHFDGIHVYHVAWWEAESISPALLDFLENDADAKYKKSAKYGPSYHTFTPDQYAAEIKRLKAQKQ